MQQSPIQRAADLDFDEVERGLARAHILRSAAFHRVAGGLWTALTGARRRAAVAPTASQGAA